MQIGIAPIDSLDTEMTHLREWLSHGYNGEMKWFERSLNKREDPRQILPNCKSVIVCVMPYDEMPKCESLREGDCDKEYPKYLRHKDYHEVVMTELKKIEAEILSKFPGAKCKCYVDTGPVLEKAWAVRAGLGFIRKNTLFISPELGSQVAIGVILCSLEAADFGVADFSLRLRKLSQAKACYSKTCETCTSCLDACPTKALIAPYVLDARKCISYKFLIEKKPGGCDICQNVCPYNK